MPPEFKSRLVIPDGYAHVTLKLTGPNTLHPPSFSWGMEEDIATPIADAITAWLNEVDTGFLANLHPNYTVDRAIIRGFDSLEEIPLSLPGTSPGTGTSPPNVSALVKLTTLSAGRRGRGRMYWPGVLGDSDINPAGQIADGTGDDDSGDARFLELQDCVDSWLTNMSTGGQDPVVLHSYRWPWEDDDPGPPVGFPAPTVITGAGLQRVVATQRRRLR